MDQLSEYYIGPGAKYPRRNMPEGLTVHVSIERIYGVGPWQKKR
jgi:hypothetical protein